jgi:hypothetical protein
MRIQGRTSQGIWAVTTAFFTVVLAVAWGLMVPAGSAYAADAADQAATDTNAYLVASVDASADDATADASTDADVSAVVDDSTSEATASEEATADDSASDDDAASDEATDAADAATDDSTGTDAVSETTDDAAATADDGTTTDAVEDDGTVSAEGYAGTDPAESDSSDATVSGDATSTDVVTASSTTTSASESVATTASTYEQTIADGTYSIRSHDNGAFALDITGYSTSSGANVQLYRFFGTDNQLFAVTWLGNGYYKIIGSGSGLAVSSAASSGSNGIEVVQLAYDGSAAQQWAIVKSGTSYLLINRATGLRLDVQGGYAGSTVDVWTWTKSDNNNGRGQRWSFTPRAVQTVSDGTYVLESTSSRRQVLDVTASGTYDGCNIAMYHNTNSSNQKFTVTYVGNGYYSIVNANSGKCVDVEGSTTKQGANISQFTYFGNPNQLWEIRSAGDGSYYLISKLGDSNSLYLDVQGGSASDGVNVWTWGSSSANDGKGQKWYFERMIADGWYTIASLDDTNEVLDVVASSHADGANVTLWHKTHYANQLWHVYQVDGRYYKLVNAESGKALDAAAGSKVNGTNVTQWSKYGTNNQLWLIDVAEDGTVTFKNEASGLYLDVEGGHAGDSVNVQTWEKTTNNDGRGQTWQLTRSRSRTGKPTISEWLGATRDIVDYLNSHLYDGYYLGTPFTSALQSTWWDCDRPYGLGGEPYGMNCAGFVADVMRGCGCDLSKLGWYPKYNGYASNDWHKCPYNAMNWFYCATAHCEYYQFATISDTLSSGVLEKGDLIYLDGVWGTAGADCHIGIFWGDTSSDDKFWNETLMYSNAITPILSGTPYSSVYVIKF